ncbi:hypothetical protein [Nonomuraea sp. NPDC052265]|uniref:hypothetical protein n=1 Tax=Nonomuraea sp. NPDC052265 TaxID=3364374 RepID=UPI0037C957D1
MVATKVGEAYVEIQPRLAKNFAKKLRDDLERQLKPLSKDLGKNIGDNLSASLSASLSKDLPKSFEAAFDGIGDKLGSEVGDSFSQQFDARVREALRNIPADGGEDVGRRLGDNFGRGFSDRARSSIGDAGRDIDLDLTRHLSNAAGSAASLAAGFGKISASAVTTVGTLSLASGAMGVAVQQALLLVAALTPVSGAFLALPAVLVGAAGAFAVFKVAVGSFTEALGASLSGSLLKFQGLVLDMGETAAVAAREFDHYVTPAFWELRKVLTDRFAEGFVGDFERLSVVLSGPLQDGLAGLSSAIGRVADDVLEFIADAGTAHALKDIWLDLAGAISTVEPAAAPLLDVFLNLSKTASGFLASFAPAIRDHLLKVADLATAYIESDSALAALKNGFAVFGQVWQLVKDILGTVQTVLSAVEKTGDNALGVIGNLVGGLRAFLDSAKGQEILLSVFESLARIGSALLPVVKALASGIASIAPTIAQIAELIGPILTTAINALAPAIATLGPALVAVFTELGKAVTILADSGALQDIALALASILVAVAPILPPLVTLISLLVQGLAYAITTWVGPALSQLVTWISEAVEWLTGAGLSEDTWLSRTLRFLYETAAPLLQQAGEIISKVFADIVTWVQENEGRFSEWGTKIQSIVTRVGEIVGGVFEFISWAWDNFGGPLLDIIGNVFSGILGVVDGVLTALSGLIEFVLGVITGDWERAWEGVKTFFSGIWDAIVAIAETIWNNLITQVKAVLALFDDNWEEHWNQVAKFAEDIWNSIVRWIGDRVDDIGDLLDWFGSLPGKFSDWFGRVKDAVVARFNDVVAFLQAIPNQILNFFSNAGSWLYNAGREIVNGLWNGIVSLWNWVVGQWDSMVTGLVNTVKSILGIASPSKVMHEMGAYLVQGLARGISKTAKVATDAVAALAASTVEAWGSPELAVAAWSVPDVAKRSPGDMRPAGDGLVTHGAAGRYGNVSVTLNAAPDIPTERQIVTALSYADALYAT